jgi:hypothetical protein
MLNDWAFSVCRIFDIHCLYQVGSSCESKNWRDVDVVAILDNESFASWFPQNGDGIDMKYRGLCIAISLWGERATGLPIDFKIQSVFEANRRHVGEGKRRNALGLSAFDCTVPDSYKHRPGDSMQEVEVQETRIAKEKEIFGTDGTEEKTGE